MVAGMAIAAAACPSGAMAKGGAPQHAPRVQAMGTYTPCLAPMTGSGTIEIRDLKVIADKSDAGTGRAKSLTFRTCAVSDLPGLSKLSVQFTLFRRDGREIMSDGQVSTVADMIDRPPSGAPKVVVPVASTLFFPAVMRSDIRPEVRVTIIGWQDGKKISLQGVMLPFLVLEP